MPERSIESDEKTRAIVALVRQRQALVTSTAPAEQAACEAALKELYRSCKKAKPGFFWCNTPVEAAKESIRYKRSSRILDFRQLTTDLGLERKPRNVTIEHGPRRRVYPTAVGTSEALLEAYSDLHAMTELGWSSPPSWAAGSVVPAKPRQSYGANLRQCIDRALLETIKGPGDELQAWAALTHSANEIVRLMLDEIIDRMWGVDIGKSAHVITNGIIQNCGHFLLREDAVFLSERPSVLRFGDNGDLHAEEEPAISYSAGHLHFFFWQGIPVPDTVALIPRAAITPDYIRAHATWLERNILVERFGIANFLTESDARVTNEDETGKLWKARFNRGKSYSWSVVEVVNGTPEPDGSFKKYFLQVPPNMRRAKQAVAWTYGLDEDRYKVAVRA